jgi:large repetitive protein
MQRPTLPLVLNVVAVTSGSGIAKVDFNFDGKLARTESGLPYTLGGDFVSGSKIIYSPYAPLSVTGSHTIQATAKASNGAILSTLIVSVSVVTGATTMPSPPGVPPPAPPPQWNYLPTSGTIRARHEACFVMVNEKCYLLGGRGIKQVSRFDPTTKKWTDRAPTPVELHHMQCVAVDDAVFIVSSWTGSYPTEVNTPFIYIYNTTANTWSTRAGLPEPRRRGGAAQVLVVQNNKREIYVSHGNRGGHGDQAVTYGWLDKYDVDLDQWTTNLPDAPNPRDHTGGGLVQNGELLCVAGGRDGGVANFFNAVVLPTDCYNLATGTWSVQPNIPQGRAGSSYGRTCDGKLMVAGGEGFGQAWSNVDVFDGTSWTSLNGLFIPRHGSGLAVSCICNEIYIASGCGAQGGSPELTTTERYLPVGSTCS